MKRLTQALGVWFGGKYAGSVSAKYCKHVTYCMYRETAKFTDTFLKLYVVRCCSSLN